MSLRNVFLFLMTFVLAAPLALSADDVAKNDAAKEGSTVVYELRTYTTNPGKMADLHKRFRDHTMRLFEKHGIKNIGYWVPIDKPDTLVYLVAHKSREAATESWKAFKADPEWQQAYKESHKNGELVKHVDQQFMTPTDYSPLK